jgi:hypothetical protein
LLVLFTLLSRHDQESQASLFGLHGAGEKSYTGGNTTHE